MNFPRYSEYKDSGVEWLGEVPRHWTSQRCRFLFEIKKRIAGEEGHDILSITQQGIRVKDIDSNDGQLSQDYSKYQLVHPGDFAMNHMDLLTGYVDVSAVPGVTSPDYRVFSLRDEQEGVAAYFLYVFQNAYKQRILYAYGQGSSQLGRWRLPTDQFNDFRLPCPPAPEQSAIAAFLDRETGKIDALVAEQEKLIELLKEKRQAVISHAVTKGLDPSVPMKDSGIPWLGEVPEHWEIKRVKHVVPEIEQGWSPEAIDRLTDPGEWGILKAGCVNRGRFTETEHKTLPVELDVPKQLQVMRGDVLMSRASGSIDLIGSVALVEACSAQLIMSDKIFRLHLDESACERGYLVRVMSSSGMRTQIVQAISGAEGLANNIGKGTIREFWLALPPLREQETIAAHLAEQSERLDALITEAQRAVGLLKERRSALISAAVTGKIDVRGLVGEEAA